jgi:hypothetical protein
MTDNELVYCRIPALPTLINTGFFVQDERKSFSFSGESKFAVVGVLGKVFTT